MEYVFRNVLKTAQKLSLAQSILLMAAILFLLFATTANGQLCGDVNGNGQLLGNDIFALKGYLLGTYSPPHPVPDANVDGICHINICDLVRLCRYFHGAAYLDCQDTSNCILEMMEGNHVEIGLPPYYIYPGGDSIAIPIRITNTLDLFGLWISLNNTSEHLEITSCNIEGSIFYDVSVIQNQQIIHFLWTYEWTQVIEPQEHGLLLRLNAQINTEYNNEAIELTPGYDTPDGDMLFVTCNYPQMPYLYQASMIYTSSCEVVVSFPALTQQKIFSLFDSTYGDLNVIEIKSCYQNPPGECDWTVEQHQQLYIYLDLPWGCLCEGGDANRLNFIPRTGTGHIYPVLGTPPNYVDFIINTQTAEDIYEVEAVCQNGSRDTLAANVMYIGYNGWESGGVVYNSITGKTGPGWVVRLTVFDGVGGWNIYTEVMADIHGEYYFGDLQPGLYKACAKPALSPGFEPYESQCVTYEVNSPFPYTEFNIEPYIDDEIPPVFNFDTTFNINVMEITGIIADSGIGLAVIQVSPGTFDNIDVFIAPFELGDVADSIFAKQIDPLMLGTATILCRDYNGNEIEIELSLDAPDFPYLPGDVNMFAGAWPPAAISPDVTYLVNFFRGLPTSQSCPLDGFWCSADANGDCNIISSDVTKLVNVFRGLALISYCPDYPPAWPTPADLPVEQPSGWPNCE